MTTGVCSPGRTHPPAHTRRFMVDRLVPADPNARGECPVGQSRPAAQRASSDQSPPIERRMTVMDEAEMYRPPSTGAIG